MVTRPPDPMEHEGAFRGSVRCGGAPARLSAAYGTMLTMRESEPAEPPGLPELPEYAERVLEVAEQVPPGRVMTYGDVAEWLKGEAEAEAASGASAAIASGGPRQVGRVLALYGGAVPWWRIVRADGVLLPGAERRALEHYRAEGTPLRPAPHAASGGGSRTPRLDLRRARWDGVVAAGGERTDG